MTAGCPVAGDQLGNQRALDTDLGGVCDNGFRWPAGYPSRLLQLLPRGWTLREQNAPNFDRPSNGVVSQQIGQTGG